MTAPATISPFATATSMLEALRAREISATELLELHLERIDRYNPRLNAIVIPNTEAARARAKAFDSGAIAGALAGLPLTIKDCIVVGGLRSTAGLAEMAENVCPADGAVAERVLGAGGVLIGKTNVPPNAGDWQSNNPVFGRTLNPWDHDRSPGGSTGGGGAAVAAGLTPLEFGSDIGGSIRVPAAFNGIYGHRPSDSVVPRSGHNPGAPLPMPGGIMGVQGPLARSPHDLELALDVIAGPEPDEPFWRLELPKARHETLASFRVAIMPPIDFAPVDAEILAAQERVVAALRTAGATVTTTAPQAASEMHGYHELYLSLLYTVLFGTLTDEQRAGAVAEFQDSGDIFGGASVRGTQATAGDFQGMLVQRAQWRAKYAAFFREYDILLAPTAIIPAFPHTDAPFQDRRLDVNGEQVRYNRMVVYPGLATLVGHGATAFPAGLSRAGLPLGLQAIGPYCEDRTPLRFAQLLEREIGGFTPPPGYGA